MNSTSFFRNSNNYLEATRIIEIQEQLSSLTEENFEEILNFLHSSIIFTSKQMMNSFSRSLVNVIRFKSNNIDLYAELAKNINNGSKYFKSFLLKLLKYCDFMTPSILKFYRLCILNEIFNEKEVIYRISIVLFFYITNTENVDSLIPLFLWFLPEIFRYVPFIYKSFISMVKLPYFSSLVDILSFDNFSNFNLFFHNEYLNLQFHYIFDPDNKEMSIMKMKNESIEYCLKADDLDQFQKLASHLDLNSMCNISVFDLVLPTTQHPTLVQFAAYEGAFRCFNFLILNHVNLKIVSKSNSNNHILNSVSNFKNKVDKINKQSPKKSQEVIEVLSTTDSEDDSKTEDNSDVIVVGSTSTPSQESRKSSSESELEEAPLEEEAIKSDTNIQQLSCESNDELSYDNDCFTEEHLDKISESMFLPPMVPNFLTSEAREESCKYRPRKPLCKKYLESMRITSTAQYAVAGGNNQIIRLIQDNDLSFAGTPQIAILCFHNDIARWLIEDVLFSNENYANTEYSSQYQNEMNHKHSKQSEIEKHSNYQTSTPQNIQSNLLYAAIITGNLQMVEYILLNMPIEINNPLSFVNLIPLHVAILHMQIDVVSFLLNTYSIDVNKMCEVTKKTPFFLAVDQKSLELMKMIVTHPSFDFTMVSCHTIRPIHYLALYGTTKMMSYFLSLKLVNINDNLMDIKLEDIQKASKHDVPKQIIEDHKTDDQEKIDWYELSEPIQIDKIQKKESNNDDAYYLSYECDLYDLSRRKFFHPIPNKDNSAPRFKYLFNTPIVCALLLNNVANFNLLLNEPDLHLNEPSDQLILHILISRNMMQIFDRIISDKEKNRIDLDLFDKVGTTALHYAVLSGNILAVRQLLKHGSNPKLSTKYEEDTVLHLAARSTSFELYKLFADMKNDKNAPLFDVNQANIKGLTVLHYAVKHHSIEIVEDLIQIRNVDVNAIDIYGNAAIHYAIYNSELTILKSLVSCPSLNINVVNKRNSTPLMCASSTNFATGIKTLLLCSGRVDPNCKDDLGNTPLHLAASKKDENTIKFLLKLRNLDPKMVEQCRIDNSNCFQYEFNPETDVNRQNYSGLTPLHIAAQKKYDQIVRVLLSCQEIRLDIVEDNQGKCPLHFSAQVENNIWFGMKMFNQYMYSSSQFSNTIFRLLINADPMCGNIQDYEGNTGFHIALHDKGFEGDILKNAAVDANHKSSSGYRGRTYFDFENYDKNEKLVLTLANKLGETYLHLAAASGNRIVLEFLMKVHPELVNAKTDLILFSLFLWYFIQKYCNDTPLHYATANGKVEMVSILILDDSLDKFALNIAGKTPLDMARDDMKSSFSKYFVMNVD